MTRGRYFAISAIYAAVMSISFIWLTDTIVSGADQTAARLVSSLVLLFGLFHLNNAGLKRRADSRNSLGDAFLDRDISPIGKVTFASFFGCNASLIILPFFVMATLDSKNPTILIALLPFLFFYLPMTQPSNSVEPETRKVPQ